MKIYDISLPIDKNTPVWPGQPQVEITALKTIVKDKVAIAKLSFSSHIGTHVDAPAHFLKQGKTVDQLLLNKLIGPVKVLDLTRVDREIKVEDLKEAEGKMDKWLSGKAAELVGRRMAKWLNSGIVERVLLKTKNSSFLKEKTFRCDYVSLSLEAAEYLVEQKIMLIGIDYLGIEKKGNPGHPVHRTLLSHGVVIVEGVYLQEVPAGEYELFCLPLKIKGADGAPARVILVER